MERLDIILSVATGLGLATAAGFEWLGQPLALVAIIALAGLAWLLLRRRRGAAA